MGVGSSSAVEAALKEASPDQLKAAVGGLSAADKAKLMEALNTAKSARPTFKLTYFPITGLGEPIRAAFALAGIAFEDERIPGDKWGAELKPTLPAGSQMPILHVTEGGTTEMFFQSRAILRYVGSIGSYNGSKLYPVDPKERYYCDEVIEMVEDVRPLFVPTMSIQDEEEKKAARLALVQPDGKMYPGLMKINERLVLHMFQQPTFLDGFKDDTFKDMPNITALRMKVFSLPPLKDYYKDAEGLRAPFKV